MTQVLARRDRPSAGLVDRVRMAYRSFWNGPLMSSDPAIARLFTDGASSATGVTVTPRNAFTFSAVYDAINQQSSDVAKLPLNLKKRRPEGGTDDYEASKLYDLMKYAPNPETDPMVFRRTLIAHAMTWHGGFAEIERNGAGVPIALWILTPDRVEPFRQKFENNTYGRLQYRIDGRDVLESRDVIHIQGLGYDGTQAYPVITLARQAIGLALAAENFGGTMFRNGRYGGILATDEDLDPEQQKTVKNDITKVRQGYEQFLVLFGKKWDYTKTAIAANEAELSKTRDQQIQEVARFFNHPLYKLKHPVPGAQSYASNEQADLDYYKGPILNWVTLTEQQLNRKLIPYLERHQQYFKHNVNAFLRGDIKSRYDALGIARDKGIISANEWRELEDMNPQVGEQGKLYLVQTAQTPLDKLDALVTSQIQKNNAPPPAPPVAPSQTEVDQANDRAMRAEALAAEAREETVVARERLAAVEASGAATAEELALRRAEVAAKESRETELIAEHQRSLDERAAALAEVTTDRDRLVAEATQAREGAQLAAERATRAEELAAAAHADLAAAQDQLRTVQASGAAAVDELTARRAEVAAMSSRTTELEAIAEFVRERSGELQRTSEERVAALAEATAAQAHGADEIARLQAEVDHLRSEATAHADADRGRHSDVLSAHRTIFIEIMRRMVDRETERARRAAVSTEKFRQFLNTFYAGHQELCETALVSTVRAQLAYTRSSEDPVALTRRLVTQHIEESQRQLRAVMDGEADEIGVSLGALLRRWETERVEVIPDYLLKRGLDYAARSHS